MILSGLYSWVCKGYIITSGSADSVSLSKLISKLDYGFIIKFKQPSGENNEEQLRGQVFDSDAPGFCKKPQPTRPGPFPTTCLLSLAICSHLDIWHSSLNQVFHAFQAYTLAVPSSLKSSPHFPVNPSRSSWNVTYSWQSYCSNLCPLQIPLRSCTSWDIVPS